MSEHDQFITRASYAVGVHHDQVAKVLDADGAEITDGDFTTPLDGCVVLVELRMVRSGDPVIVREARRVLPQGAGHEHAVDDDGNVIREIVPDDDEIARRAELAAEADGDTADDEESAEGDGALEDLTVAELRDLAADRDVVVSAKATKAELIEVLTEAGGDTADEDDEGGD
jgi:hypothetical protein